MISKTGSGAVLIAVGFVPAFSTSADTALIEIGFAKGRARAIRIADTVGWFKAVDVCAIGSIARHLGMRTVDVKGLSRSIGDDP